MRELRQSKSLDTFEHLARLAAPARLQELLLPLRGVLATTDVPKTLRVADECLRRIAAGIGANPHVDNASLLVLCHALIARGEGALRHADAAADAPHLAQNAHLFVALGLDLLTTALRRARFDLHDAPTLAKLMPMVGAVGETLYARNAPVVERGCRATAALARCALPNLPDTLPVLQRQLLLILRHAGGVHSAVAQAALRALAVVLREGRGPAPSERQLAELLRLVATELDAPDAQASVFALLRAVVARAFVVPEVYDVMDRVAELLVTSHDSQVREVCRALYLQFLLDYPQGKGRLTNQIQFLAKNVAFELEGGRRSVLELLGAVVTKFAPDVVSAHAELLFVALVMQLANDDVPAVRQQTAHVLRVLLATVDDAHLHAALRLTRSWAATRGGAHAAPLAAVALRVFELAAERPGALALVAPDALDAAAAALHDAAAAPDADAWRLVYQALQTAQSLAQRDAAVHARLAATDADVISLLTFPHAWVRVAACRLLGARLAAGADLSAAELVRAARQLVAQLYSEHLDDALTLQVVRNLVFLGRAMAAGAADGAGDVSPDEDAIDEAAAPDAPPRLAWLFSKLSHAARLTSAHGRPESAPRRVGAVLKWFAAIATQLPPTTLCAFLVHMLSPIQRVVEDEQAPEDLRTLASEVQDLVQERVGPTAFTHAYAHVRQKIVARRHERRHARVLESIADPERGAARRAARNAAKHESRKRKNASFRDQRSGKKRASHS